MSNIRNTPSIWSFFIKAQIIMYICTLWNTYSKKYEVFLIIFPYTIVNPWTVMIHFSDASAIATQYNRILSCYITNMNLIKLNYLWQTEQWWALSGLIEQHFGHLKITCPSLNPICCIISFVALPFGTAPCIKTKYQF